jgi:glycosyltransferase involved in cell wall biosynthesis
LVVNADIKVPSISIMLSTFNGARFLPEQLRSFERQTHANWSLLAGDDGSADETIAILRAFQNKHGPDRISVRVSPHRGFVASFLSLACEPNLTADYYAFSDQDDVWQEDKLARAIAWLRTVPADMPAVYASRTSLVDPIGSNIGASPLFRKPPTFCNALVQSIAGGNTMVFNEAARQLLAKTGVVDVPSHDWWLYLLVTGSGGIMHYDSYCSVRYRRHEHNITAYSFGTVARAKRLRMLIQGRFKQWTDQNLAALERFRPHMSAASQRAYDLFGEARKKPLIARMIGFHRSGVYRQTVFGSISLAVGALINKI